MKTQIHQTLAPVRRRQRMLAVLRMSVLGVLASAVVGLAIGAARLASGEAVSIATALCVLIGGPVAGVLAGLARRCSWHAAARAVDRQYPMHDRAITALDFLARPEPTPLNELQLHDAYLHLVEVKPRQVVPLCLPRAAPYAAALFGIAVALLVWPLGSRGPGKAGPSAPLAAIVEEATGIEEDLIKPLDKLVQEEGQTELGELVRQLRELAEEMKQPGVDTREALAKLSDMQAAIAVQRSQFNTELVDAQLAALGQAMTSAAALKKAGSRLAQREFDEAAKELEGLQNAKFERREAKATAERVGDAAQAMREAHLDQLSEATAEMAKTIRQNDPQMCQQAARELAGLCRAHGRRGAIAKLLQGQLALLRECKERCQGQNSLAKGHRPQKSYKPGSKFGMASSGNLDGQMTDLAANRQLTHVAGMMGEGSSEVETTLSGERQESATRTYREIYQQYRKLSESVLESEPLPLGHRQTIRRYFESIRPQDEDISTEANRGKR